MARIVTLTEDELEILLQALSARANHLRDHTSPADARRCALPTIADIKAKAADALLAIWVDRRQHHEVGTPA